MNSRTTRRFRRLLAALPPQVQRQAKEAYMVFRSDPLHPSLRFKPLAAGGFYSVRIGRRYRALGRRDATGIVWVWIGSHADFDQQAP